MFNIQNLWTKYSDKCWLSNSASDNMDWNNSVLLTWLLADLEGSRWIHSYVWDLGKHSWDTEPRNASPPLQEGRSSLAQWPCVLQSSLRCQEQVGTSLVSCHSLLVQRNAQDIDAQLLLKKCQITFGHLYCHKHTSQCQLMLSLHHCPLSPHIFIFIPISAKPKM